MGDSGKQIAGIGEKVQYLLRNYNDNTIRFVLHYPGRVASDVLRAATKALVESVDILHASFFTDDSQAYWNIHEDYEENDYFQLIDTEEDPMDKACELALLTITPQNKTQLRCYLVRRMTESVIVLNVSHLCVDGRDGKYLLEKLVEAYNRIMDEGNAQGLGVKNGSRAAEQIYENISKKDYRSLMKNPVSRVKSEFPYPTKESGSSHIVSVNVSETVMSKVLGRAKLQGVTLNDVLITACYYAYASLPGKNVLEPMSIMSMIDLRRHCKDGDSEGLCNITRAISTTLPIGLKERFSDTLSEVAIQTKAIKDNPLAGLEGMPILHSATKNLPMKMLLPIVGKLYGSSSIELINLGDIASESLQLGNIQADYGLFGGPMKKKPSMQISIVSIGGSCTLCVVGEYTDEDAVLIRMMLDKMVEQIEKHTLF